MQYNNPDAPQQQVAYSDQPDPRVEQPQQPLAATSSAGGSAMPGTTTGYTTTRYEEKDPEAQQQMYDNPATMTTTTTATTRQTVRPSPTHNAAVPTKITISTQQQQQQRSGGGFIGNFATRSRGGFFFPLHAAIVFFSFLVLVSSALIEDRAPALGNRRFVQYALVVGQISFAVSLGSCVMERLGLLNNRHLRVALSAFQVFFWMPALVLLTFFGVFVSPLVSANGFFGAWGALTASAVAFSHESERSQRNPRKSAAPRTSLFLLFFTSLMIMGAGIRLYNDQRGAFDLPDAAPWSYTVFSIAFGAITAFLSVMFLIALDMTPPKAMISFGTFLWLWVAVGILVITFADPFEQAVGNGYYASLFALLSSFGLLVSLRRNERDSDVPRSGDATTGGAGGPTTTTGGTNNVQATTDAAGNTTYTTTTATRTNQPPVRRESETSATFFLFVRGGTFASLVVLVAACMTCREVGGCQGNIQRFQIAAGAVSLGLGLIVVLLEAFGLYRIHSIFKIAFAFFWLLWWIACFIVLTFFGSFQSPALTLTFFANGFFFTWVALIFAALAFAEALKERGQLSNPPSHHVAKTGYLLLIVIGSAIELGAAIKWYYDTDFSQLSKYALTLGSASIGLVLILYFILLCARKNVDAHDSTYNAGLYFLTVWWAVGTLVLTYEGFWSSAIDNGYFSVFFTLGACLLALSGMWKRDDDDEYDDDNQYNYRNQEGTATRAYQ